MALESTGFVRDRLADIKADYDERFTNALGPVNTNPDAVVGQIIGIFAAAMDDVQEALQDIYDAMYPSSAEGASLDGSVSFVGLERLGASATTVTAACYGAESTLLPTGVLTRSGNKQYASTVDSVITRANALAVEVEILNVLNNTSYQIIAGGELAEYTSSASANASEIASGLAAAFNVEKFKAIATGSGTITIVSADNTTGYPITVDNALNITKLSSPVVFTGIEIGANAVPIGSLTIIDTPTLGWYSVNNFAAGTIGRNVETDSELRTRHLNSVRATGSATVKAMRARLLAEVPEITAAYIYENRTSVTVDDMPPHSVEAVVVGGTNAQVRQKIWEVKPAGIETHGNSTGIIVDENGDSQTIKFSRPTNKYAWILVSVNQINSEEALTLTVADAIRDAVLAFGQSLNVGQDIITQRFYGPIYNATSGLGQITVEAAVTIDTVGPPSYSINNVTIGRAEIAVFDFTRIVVVGV